MLRRFDELIEMLGKEINLPLHVDDKNSCSIIVDEKLLIQIEPTEEEKICIAIIIDQIEAGKHRENVLKYALIANSDIFRAGTLGYNEPTNELILFTYLPMKNLTANDFATNLASLTESAFTWKEAVRTGSSFPIEKSSRPASLFEQKPNYENR